VRTSKKGSRFPVYPVEYCFAVPPPAGIPQGEKFKVEEVLVPGFSS